MARDILTVKHSSFVVNLHLFVAIVWIAFTALQLFSGDPVDGIKFVFLVTGFLFLFSGLWHRKQPYVTVSEDTLTIHRMLLKNKVIPLADLTRIGSYAGDVRLFFGDSKTTLDRSKIDTADHQTLMAFLRQAVPEVEFSV